MSKSYRRGKTKSNRPPEGEPWTWMTRTMLGSLTFQALSINARRVLDFLQHEHIAHGGRENGNLAATYLQLQAWGVTRNEVRKAFAELYATGFIRLVHQGERQAGGGEPSRYALTWLPTLVGSDREAAPTHEWRAILDRLAASNIGGVRDVRRWLHSEVDNFRRGQKKQKPTPQLQPVSPPKCGPIAV